MEALPAATQVELNVTFTGDEDEAPVTDAVIGVDAYAGTLAADAASESSVTFTADTEKASLAVNGVPVVSAAADT